MICFMVRNMSKLKISASEGDICSLSFSLLRSKKLFNVFDIFPKTL